MQSMTTAKNVMKMIKDNDVKYVDFRFTDPRGKWQHLAHHVRTITEDFLTEGVMFDGSSIAGWKAINESDMLLAPDCSTAVLDPFAGSCVTGEVCERLRRKWTCVEMREEYLRGALGRFERPRKPEQESMFEKTGGSISYKLHHPGALWNGHEEPLEQDGGKTRRTHARNPA